MLPRYVHAKGNPGFCSASSSYVQGLSRFYISHRLQKAVGAREPSATGILNVMEREGKEGESVYVRRRENVSTICVGCIRWHDRIRSPGRLRNGTSHCGKAEEWTGSPPAAPDSQAFFPDKVAPPTRPPEASWHHDMGLGPCQLPTPASCQDGVKRAEPLLRCHLPGCPFAKSQH